VVIPAYERSAELPRALASVFAQRRPAAEVVVVDDGSTDATAEVAEGLGATVVRHPENRGLSAARNSGVAAATQPWLAFLDSDDEWLPHHLETLWPLAEQGHVLVGGSTLRRGPDPADDEIQGPPRDRVEVVRSPARVLFPHNVFSVSAAMAQADLVRELGGFRPFYGVEDLDLWVRILERGTGAVTPEVTAIYHVHEQQMSQQVDRMQDGHRNVVREHTGKPWWSPALLERADGYLAWNNVRSAVRRGRPVEVARLLLWLARRPQRAVGAAVGSASRRRLVQRSRRR
jgi:glycosyltransferase involved in cell wall biosynthesis